MKYIRIAILALLGSVVHADYFEDYIADNPQPLTVVVVGGGNQLSWPDEEEICKTRVIKNGVHVDSVTNGPWVDVNGTSSDQYYLEFQSCVTHIHSQMSNVAGAGAVNPTEDKAVLLANLDDMGAEDTRGLKAFPGAVGYAEDATGGRGGDVVIVTTVADNCTAGDGQITAREAITSCGDVANTPRIVTFNVGGRFDFNAPFLQADSNITVACQTAPTWVNFTETFHYFGGTNAIWRHCTMRGDGTPILGAGTDRAMDITTGASNIIVDHLSTSWHQDGEFVVYQASNEAPPSKITFSNGMAGRGDGSQSSSPGLNDSATGPMCLGNNPSSAVDGCTFTSNYVFHQNTRTADLWTADGETVNNIVYNHWDNGIGGQDIMGNGLTDVHVDNNCVKQGPIGIAGVAYSTTNRVQGSNNYYQANVNGSACGNQVTINSGTPNYPTSAPILADIVSLANDADYMACRGASFVGQDNLDAAWVQDFYNGTGPDFNALAVINRDYSQYVTQAHLASYDSDNDGIADAWEQALIDADTGDTLNSLADIDHTTDDDNDGYLDIEEFINELARCPHVPGF